MPTSAGNDTEAAASRLHGPTSFPGTWRIKLDSTTTTRVLHIASGDLWAGAEAQVLNLARALHAMDGVQISVILLNHGTLEDRLDAAGVDVHVIDETRLNAFRILGELVRLMRKLRPDVVHTHRTKENILGSIAALLAGRLPSVRTVHGDSEHALRWWQVPKRLIQAMDRITGRYLQRTIISVSADLTGILSRRYPVWKLRTIENGIDIAAITGTGQDSGTTAAGASPVLRIGFAGRLVPVKRIDLVIETARLLLDKPGNTVFEFSIFGDGPLSAGLQALSRRVGVDKQVRFHGHSDDITGELRRLDVVLMTSDHEGLPMVILEAMALRKAIVAHATGGIPTLLDNGNSGILVQQHTPEGYADALATLAADAGLRKRLGDNAWKRVNEFYSADKNARAILQLYRSIND